MREIKFRAFEGGVMHDDDSLCCPSLTYSEIKQMNLMQWTGLKDKNGKEIYEGDICRCQGKIVEIFWNTGLLMWDHSSLTFDEHLGCHELEVIGNIYENPELLEKK